MNTVTEHRHKPVRHLAYGKDFKYHVDFVQHAKIQADLKRKERNKKRQINAVKGGYLRHDVILQLVDLV